MKKRFLVIIISMCIMFSLCSCENQEDINTETNESEIKQDINVDDRLVDSLPLSVDVLREVNSFPISYLEVSLLEKNAWTCYAFCVEKDSIYYALYFGEDNALGHKEFTSSDNTQIRVYNMNTQEDRLLYLYEEDFFVEVTDMYCNGEILIWEDYGTSEEMWTIKGLALDEDEKVEVLIEGGMYNNSMSTITPTLTDDAIYWYDVMDAENGEYALYKYDLSTREISLMQAYRNLATPYTHVPIIDGVLTTYKYQEDTSIIDIYKDADVARIEVPGHIDDARSNGKICAWKTDINGDNLLNVYDIRRREHLEIDCGYFFSYALYDNYIIVNQENGLYVYDILTKTYSVLKETDEVEYLYMFTGKDSIYAEIKGDGFDKFSLLVIR